MELPDLPPPDLEGGGYTDQQVRDFAQFAVLQERERCARIVESQRIHGKVAMPEDYSHNATLAEIAAAIRQQRD